MNAISAALILLSTVSLNFKARAQPISEDQAAQILGAQLRAEDSTQLPSTPSVSKTAQDSANNTVCAKSVVEKRKVSWCLQPTDRSKNPYVIYFFHGLTLDEHRWQEAQFSNDLQAIWKAKGLTPPTVVSISFGPVWLLTQTRDKKYDFFINSLMPYFENIIGPVSNDQRIAMGESMGGFNVSQLMLKSPELFSRFVLQCPAVTEVGPFDKNEDLLSFIKRTGADSKRAILTKIIGMYEFQTEAEWLQHSPIYLSTMGTRFPTKVYLSCGNHDKFGFYEGVDMMDKLLLGKTDFLQYVFIPGGEHGTVDTQSMADFVSADWAPTP